MSPASPTKITGGGGFVFENRVAAFYLAAMLSRSPIEPELGELVQVAAQQGQAGWTGGLDDLVLTFERESEKSDLALSVKSYAPFSAQSAPRDLVSAAWRHIRPVWHPLPMRTYVRTPRREMPVTRKPQSSGGTPTAAESHITRRGH